MAILVRTGAILVFLSVFPGAERVSGQRAPCYQCEDYKENHPQTSPYQQIRTHCSYPCECEDKEPTCPPDVSVIRDGCGCCPICASQLGHPCDGNSVCDDRKGLVCRYPYLGATVGVCQATTGLPCMVSNKTYNHGETFHMDCRTQCSCQNGTYACSSLCPNENISPRGACTHPRLVEVPDQCCREWMCDSTEAEHPPVCKQEFTSWSTCSAPCGLGISQRISNLNQDCVLQNETRICQLRPCEAGMLSLEQHARHHHIRKGHECKATQRVSGPVRLRFGPCRSKKRYRPKFCGSCDDKVGDGCCTPQLSTTIKVEFICDSITKYEDPDDILLDLIEPGRDLWWPDDLLAIGKQQQQQQQQQEQQQSEVRSTTSSFLTWNDSDDKSTTIKKLVFRGKSDDFEKFRESLGWESRKKSGNSKKQKQIPYYDYPGKSQYNSKSPPPVSKADMHLLENKNKLNEPLLGADVLVYDPGYDERNYRIVDGRSGVDLVTASIKNEEESMTNARTTQQITTEAATTETTTVKPKKKKKKKPRKAFTSWLEFRDEEYQMDEYEDEEEEQNRKKRSANASWDVGGKVVKRTHRDGDITDEKVSNRSENRSKRNAGSFREGHLEDSDDDYEDDDENDEDDEDDGDDDEDDDEDDDDDRDGPERKPLVYSFYRRKRGAPKVLDYRSLDKVPKSSQFLTAQEKLKKKKLKKEKEGKYKNQIERKSNLLKKIMNERKISSMKEIEKHNQEARKRKNKKKSDIKHKETLKEQKINPPQSRTIEKGNVKTLSKLERIVTERSNNNAFNKSGQLDSVTRPHPKKETIFHTAGKVHKSRTKRHAPRPPWTEDEGVESEDLTWGDHSVSFSVQWIVKCRCERDCGLETTTASSELNNDGEIILRRVHRTAPP